MTPINIHYRHILFDSDGKSITPLIPADDLPSDLFTVLPPNDRNLVMLREIPQDATCFDTSSVSGPKTAEVEEPVGRRWECGSAVGSESDRQPQPPAGTVEGDPEPRASNPSGVAGTGLQKKGSRSSAAEKEQPCVYFGRREGCKRGPNCRFVHDNTTTTDAQKKQLALTETWRRNGPSQDDESPEAVKESAASSSLPPVACATPGRIVSTTDPRQSIKTHCTFFLRFGECDYWPNCKFSHERPDGACETKAMRHSPYSWGRLRSRGASRSAEGGIEGAAVPPVETGMTKAAETGVEDFELKKPRYLGGGDLEPTV